MSEAPNSASFEKIVEWAYNTLPEKIRNLPDFPGIQVVDEPPEEMFRKMSKRRKWPGGTELLGCYSGVSRTQRQFNLVQTAPDLIFVFRGPIVRCSRGSLPAEIKQVVWHEVAHWLGHDEIAVKELGLSLTFKDIARVPLEGDGPRALSQEGLAETVEYEEQANQKLRCIKCYSTDVTCRELDKQLSSSGAWLTDPILIYAKICTCRSCGCEWDDADSG